MTDWQFVRNLAVGCQGVELLRLLPYAVGAAHACTGMWAGAALNCQYAAVRQSVSATRLLL